jgi:hypothetical protein
MKYVEGFGKFWYDFIVGDDWTIAAGIVGIMAAAYLLHRGGLGAWWLFLPAIFVLLFFTVKRAARD